MQPASARIEAPPRPRLLPILLLLPLTILSPPRGAGAQEFGQWWWEGSLGIGQRRSDNLREGSRITRFDQQELRLSFGLNGFLLHPALGDFHLGLDLILSELDNGKSLDTDRTGFDLDLNILPRGAYPVRVFARRQAYEYSGQDGLDPLVLSRLPETTSLAGARVRLRRGLLKGSLVGVERTDLTFSDPDSDDEIDERAFFDWSRKLGGLQNHVRLERRLRDFGLFDLEIEDFSLNFDQQGYLTPVWGWQVSGIGILRDTTLGADRRISTDDLRLRNRLFRAVHGNDQLDILTNLSSVRSEGAPANDAWGTAVFYRWRPRPGWEVAPFVEATYFSAGPAEARAPRGGVSASWSRDGRVESLVTTEVSYGTVSRDEVRMTEDESRVALAITGSVAHGRAERLRKELEVQITRNELRLSREPILDLPDLGLPGEGLNTEDQIRTRFTLGHRWRNKWLSVRGDWSQLQATGPITEQVFESQTFSGYVQLSGSTFSLQGDAGQTQVDRAAVAEQTIRFDGITATWRPWRGLNLRTSYRTDRRMLLLTPDIDTERLELGARIRFGQLILNLTAFQTQERFDGGFQRENNGFTWSVSRRFSGWLPIVTGSQRRGVIR